MLRLNLGSSDDHKPGYVNVDIAQPADVVFDLGYPWITKWAESTVDEIYAHDVFEHIFPRDFSARPKVWVMNQAWTILKPGGLLDLAVPCVYLKDGRVNPGAFADPTHVSYFTDDDRYYFTTEWNNPQGERGRLGPAYGIQALFKIRRWELLDYGLPHERRSKIIALLEAVK